MKVLFLTMGIFPHIRDNNIYADLMRKFRKEGHNVYIISPCERREGKDTYLTEDDGVHFLRVKTLNIQKTNVIEKGVGQLLLEKQFMTALKKYFGNVKFDIILYSTPPITFTKVIKWTKRQCGGMAYLMLKDIFPQNAIDLGLLSKTGLKGFLYRSFKKKEEKLYRISDYIGCMSPANVTYLMKNNPWLDPKKIEICPNSYEVPSEERKELASNRTAIREKYNLPADKPIFIYGGNLGKPQGIPFLIECLDANKNREDCHLLVIGNGFEYERLKNWYDENHPKSVSIFRGLTTEDYEQLTAACDVGLIFLDYHFSIPNFPSRLLPYLICKKPILACTDPVSDVGEIAVKNEFGFYCESNDVNAFTFIVDEILKADIKQMGENAYQFFLNNYTVDHSYEAIMKHVKN